MNEKESIKKYENLPPDKKILEELDKRDLSFGELLKRTKLSKPTLSRKLRWLVKEKVIKKTGGKFSKYTLCGPEDFEKSIRDIIQVIGPKTLALEEICSSAKITERSFTVLEKGELKKFLEKEDEKYSLSLDGRKMYVKIKQESGESICEICLEPIKDFIIAQEQTGFVNPPYREEDIDIWATNKRHPWCEVVATLRSEYHGTKFDFKEVCCSFCGLPFNITLLKAILQDRYLIPNEKIKNYLSKEEINKIRKILGMKPLDELKETEIDQYEFLEDYPIEKANSILEIEELGFTPERARELLEIKRSIQQKKIDRINAMLEKFFTPQELLFNSCGYSDEEWSDFSIFFEDNFIFVETPKGKMHFKCYQLYKEIFSKERENDCKKQ